MEKLPAIYYGSQAPPVPARELHAGSLACLYVAGSIRHICAGETEIINRVYLALRDRNWGTVPGTLSEADGWLGITSATVRAWAQANDMQPYALIRTLGHLPGCRVTPDGGLMVREAP